MAIAFFQACLCSRQWYGITKWEAIASSPHHNGILRLNSNSNARFCLSLHMALDCSQMYCLLATSANRSHAQYFNDKHALRTLG